MREIDIHQIVDNDALIYSIISIYGKFSVKLDFLETHVEVYKVIDNVSETYNIIDFYKIIKNVDTTDTNIIYPLHLIKESISDWHKADFREYILNDII